MKRYETVTLGRATPFAYRQMALLQLGVMTYSQAERGLFFPASLRGFVSEHDFSWAVKPNTNLGFRGCVEQPSRNRVP